ncbi:MAG TPA: POTRA domain-containing protein [Ramlibacter sp.]|jgi:hemolysin activation/secretion protein|uniref:ShlB/FhaC/HecB family hemolysin secretion/activation protein n=1 Tax=Ramlibacter sp. TaxID=1917967 RepID=UPI002D69DCBF|nr:POTRA domain-containing protein [Ramlibacter sp.]HZY19063.1 POTRA domain-containing protein [Ramlibacter sp.]
MSLVRRTTLSLAVLSAFQLAHAQAVPDAGTVLQQLPQPLPSRPAAPLPALGGKPTEPPMAALPRGGREIAVQRFELVGNREIDTASLQAEIAGAAGKPLTLAQIEEVATRLTRFYRARGYFVARVYVPQQEIKDGVVTLRAVEGNYGRFVLKNGSLVADDIVQAMLDDVKKFDIVSTDTLERAMLIINDTPGVRVVRADVMPGQAVGTSDFAVETAATRRHTGYVLVDNHGSRYTGRERLSARWDWNSPSGRGDRLSASGLATRSGDLLNGRLAYSASLAPNGLRGEAAVSRTTYELAGVFAPLGVVGRADAVDLALSYPVKRTEAQTVEAGLALSHKDLRDEIRSTSTVTPKRSDALSATLGLRDDRKLLGREGLTQASATLTAGVLDIRSETALQFDQAAGGPDTDGRFSKLNLSLSRLTMLPHQFTLTAGLRHQTALGGKNLDSSERLSVAGAGGVMAYPPGELSGSDATALRLELGRPLPVVGGFQQQWLAFTNVATARAVKSDPSRTLSDVGLGWSAAHPQGLTVKAWWAYRLQGQEARSEEASRGRLLLQAGWSF